MRRKQAKGRQMMRTLLPACFLFMLELWIVNMKKKFYVSLNNSDILPKFAFGKQNVMLADVDASRTDVYGLTSESKQAMGIKAGWHVPCRFVNRVYSKMKAY